MTREAVRHPEPAVLPVAPVSTIAVQALLPDLAVADCNLTLVLQGMSFQVQSLGEGSQHHHTTTTTGAKSSIKPIHQTVHGQVLGTQVADPNGNGTPVIDVFVQGLIPAALARRLPIREQRQRSFANSLLELTGSHAQGYLAHDWLAVEEGCPLGRFPIDKPGDTNAKPAVSERRIGSNLMSGEASWILRPTGMLKF